MARRPKTSKTPKGASRFELRAANRRARKASRLTCRLAA